MPEPRRTVRLRERRQVKGTASPARWGSAIDAHAAARQRERDDMAAMVIALLERLSTDRPRETRP